MKLIAYITPGLLHLMANPPARYSALADPSNKGYILVLVIEGRRCCTHGIWLGYRNDEQDL
jgi:hypothetical protein